jgi:DNA-directed RNA polymerase specialized sigma24 family protein
VPTSVFIVRSQTSVRILVLLREALSSNKSPFAKLIRSGQDGLLANDVQPESTEVTARDQRPYRMNRKLSPDEQAELVALYEAGTSMLELSRKFETHRTTVVAHLRRAGAEIRPQRKMTPELVAQATALYGNGHSLAEIGRMFGLEASTIGKALKRAGVQLRPPVADRRHGSRSE